MLYLLDSDWFIDYLDGSPPAVQLVGSLVNNGVSISIITYIEVYQGVYRRHSTEADEALAAALTVLPVLPLSLAIAERCAGFARRCAGRDGGSTAGRWI